MDEEFSKIDPNIALNRFLILFESPPCVDIVTDII